MLLRHSVGSDNPYLEIILYRNRLQLATNDALYSDGNRYRPAVIAVNSIKEHLGKIQTVLVLGAGLGSIVHVLRTMGGRPHCTLVEKDKVVLEWAMEFMQPNSPDKIVPICNDAEVFMRTNAAKYDLIFVDIFNGRVVPQFVSSQEFLQNCMRSLLPGGCIAFNYIINDKEAWENTSNTFAGIFPANRIIKSGINRILIGEL